jgi:hypothetical protein
MYGREHGSANNAGKRVDQFFVTLDANKKAVVGFSTQE